jgi:hypothetical protein
MILIFIHLGTRIPGLNNNKREGGSKKFVALTFFFEAYVILELVKKKIWANLQKKIKELFTQKNCYCYKLSKIWFEIGDPRSRRNLFRIPGSKRHRIPDLEHLLQCTSIYSKDGILPSLEQGNF